MSSTNSSTAKTIDSSDVAWAMSTRSELILYNLFSTSTEHIIEMPNLEYESDPRGIGYDYYKAMLKYKDNIAQIDGLTGETDTYGAFLKRSVRVAIAMKKRGIKLGDVVSVCTSNHLDSGTPHVASFFVGAVMAAIHQRLNLKETIHLLRQITPKMIFIVPRMVETVEAAIKEIGFETELVVFGETNEHTPFSEFLRETAEEESFEPTAARSLLDTALILFTSGTSGLPKGICHNHDALLWSKFSKIDAGYMTDISLTYASPYWSLFINSFGSSILTGTARLVVPGFDPVTFWSYFKHKISFLSLTPSQVYIVNHQPKPKDLDLTGLKYVCVGGSVLSKDKLDQIQEMFPHSEIFNFYGQTDLPGSITLFRTADSDHMALKRKKPNSTGKPVAGLCYKIVNAEVEEIVGPNQKGELRIKPQYRMNGYVKDDFSQTIDADGWLRTGDIAYYDEEHCFYVIDRLKEVIKFRSGHVVPSQIEDLLLKHPAIGMAVVVGIPHETDEERALAVVVLKSGGEDVSAEEVIKFVEDRVDFRQRLWGGVKFVENIPLTATGKVSRKEVKNMVLSGKI